MQPLEDAEADSPVSSTLEDLTRAGQLIIRSSTPTTRPAGQFEREDANNLTLGSLQPREDADNLTVGSVRSQQVSPPAVRRDG